MSKHTIIPLLAAVITLWAVAANAALTVNGESLNGVPLNGESLNGMSQQGKTTGTTDALVPTRMVLPDGTVLTLR